jgi:hypothetical protein
MRTRPYNDVPNLVRKCVTQDPVEASQSGPAHYFDSIRIDRDLHPALGARKGVPKCLRRETARRVGEDLDPQRR